MERASICRIEPVGPVMEDDVEPKGHEDGQAHDAPLAGKAPARHQASMRWPWGLVAIGVMALAWVGIYLLWQGILFAFS